MPETHDAPPPARRPGAVDPLRIALVATSRYPVRQPFAGGLEALVWDVATCLRRDGHDVTLFAAEGSDDVDEAHAFPSGGWDASRLASEDPSMPSRAFMSDHHAYLRLMMDLAGRLGDEFDVVHNHSLHHLPIAMAPLLQVPMVTTLHTPPTPWLESAVGVTGGRGTVFTCVSAHTARQWTALGQYPRVVRNGVDTARWPQGPGGGDLLWSGRLVPEKAPHLAIDAARLAGRRLRIAGPMSDLPYFEQAVRPRLGRGVSYIGHLEQAELARVVGEAAAVLVTPQWDEPYGLVVAEALACGTPVVAFARGGVLEVLTDPSLGRLVGPGDVEAMAEAVTPAEALDRDAVRVHAVAHLSHTRMVEAYTALYRELVAARSGEASASGTRSQTPLPGARRARPRAANASSHPAIGNQPQRA